MWFNIQTVIVLIVPALWVGYCLFVLFFGQRLKEPAKHRKAGMVLFLMACYLGLGEGAAGFKLRSLESPSSYDESRNPHFLGDWVGYTEPPSGEKTGYRVIVISNSQGFMRERPEAELCYSGMLEAKLRVSGYGENAEVLNWSIPGGGAMELIILAARAVAHQPDVVILSGYNNDFNEYWNQQKLSSMASDIVHLAYLAEVRKNIPRRFLINIRAFSARDWLGMNSNLVAWHNWFTRDKDEWTFISREPGPRKKLTVFDLNPTVSIELIENFVQAAVGNGEETAIKLVSMPLNGDQFKGFQQVDEFFKAATKVAQAWPQVGAFDATHLYPVELFYGGRHMRPEAHKMFADYLFAMLPPPPNALD